MSNDTDTQQESNNNGRNNDELDLTLPVFCTAFIPAELLNEYFTEAFEAKELKYVGCTHIAILVDTLDITKLTKPTHAPVKEDIEYPFLGWNLDDLVEFASQLDRGKGLIDTEFVILDEQTLQDKTVVLVTPQEMYDGIGDAPRLTARSDVQSSLITLNGRSLGVWGDEPWELAAEKNGVIRLYDDDTKSAEWGVN
ncbi:hypothetical protein P153DRAFT_378741 [Dothidotthia symphoricarpi CBS 119687]|uniref:Uncharacterized protein n=1 Tax=Dothidotthia symphoricarpi CBS 119687 TaxID=1392245 RepID=A0A6A6A3T2_9PLEO|nr:uncharacterized protein P153DRAFT_378741 [Dothidotthia symphoricarpi CBS 119687]KAF2125241.1 hypothetical protein P153DRAFT_378741 [Dothidotthia symphoricarpi CBS 119687]